MKILLLPVALIYLLAACNGQSTIANNTVSNFHFKSIFGTKATDSSHMYCLLGNGFVRTPSSNNADSMIEDWIKTHQNAQIIPVTASEMEMDEKHHKIKLTYCWITDGKDTINNFLVRNGCFPNQTMIRPLKWEEMSAEEREVYDNDKVGYGTTEVFINDESFGKFMEQIQAADQYAYEHYLGIWKDEELRNKR